MEDPETKKREAVAVQEGRDYGRDTARREGEDVKPCKKVSIVFH